MSHFNKELPASLHTRLHRWYRISGSALLCMLVLLSAVHIHTIMRFYTIRRTLCEQQAQVAPVAVSSRSCEQIERHRKEHQQIYTLLQTLLTQMPDSAALTHLMIQPYAAVLCEGISSHTTAITDLIEVLKKAHYTTIVQLVTNQKKSPELGFTLRVARETR